MYWNNFLRFPYNLKSSYWFTLWYTENFFSFFHLGLYVDSLWDILNISSLCSVSFLSIYLFEISHLSVLLQNEYSLLFFSFETTISFQNYSFDRYFLLLFLTRTGDIFKWSVTFMNHGIGLMNFLKRVPLLITPSLSTTTILIFDTSTLLYSLLKIFLFQVLRIMVVTAAT